MTYTATRVFDHTTAEAEIGDYFKLPYQPVFRVVAKIDLGGYVSFLVQSGQNTPEQWDVMKPEAELAEQERNRIETEEREVQEVLSMMMPPERLDWISQDDWLNEPIGAGLDYIFGMTGEQQAEFLPPVETGYNEYWTTGDTEF